MHLITLVLASILSMSSGRRVHRSLEPLHSSLRSKGQKPLKADDALLNSHSLAKLLLAAQPLAQFNPSGPGAAGARFQMTTSSAASSGMVRNMPVRAAEAATVEVEAASDPVNIESTPDPVPETKAAISPGQAEKEIFQCDPSCKVWEDFRRYNTPTALEDVQSAAAIVAKYMPGPFDGLGNTAAVQYWAGHAARTSYFLANAVAGTLSFQMLGQRPPDAEPTGLDDVAGLLPLAGRLIHESIKTYEQDWQCIEAGIYKQPWDMTPGHRQGTLPYMLDKSARFVEEAIGTLERRARGKPEDRTIWLDSSDYMYPDYYRTNYHYQTDGWMSPKSAAVYETSTETLFLGKQDAMQRLSLIPLQGLKGENGKPPKILEVACGTGRFATFLRDNHPEAELTCVDLSPFYLDAARENDEYWRKFTSRNGGKLHPPATFVQAAAEALPFKAESFDAVVCVYLFHEMPEEARAAAAAEMARVVKPGGTVVLTDSLQRGDRPVQDPYLINFEKLNEPHYGNYIDTHLADLFVPHGLEPGQKYQASSTKMVSFTKPENMGIR